MSIDQKSDFNFCQHNKIIHKSESLIQILKILTLLNFGKEANKALPSLLKYYRQALNQALYLFKIQPPIITTTHQ